MAAFASERVLDVRHWTDAYFSFTTTRDDGLRFENGQFVMIGLQQPNGRPLMRAYSIASPNYEEHLEFFSIKVQNGPLTSQLQHLKEGDEIEVNLSSGEIFNRTNGNRYQARPLPDFVLKIAEAGGIVNFLKGHDIQELLS